MTEAIVNADGQAGTRANMPGFDRQPVLKSVLSVRRTKGRLALPDGYDYCRILQVDEFVVVGEVEEETDDWS